MPRWPWRWRSSYRPAAEAPPPEEPNDTPDTPPVSEPAAPQLPEGALVIAEQGMFSSGGTVTEPVEGEYDETTNWLELERHGNTAHVGHANVLYQIPAEETGLPMVYLHGYGQSRIGRVAPDRYEGSQFPEGTRFRISSSAR